MILKVPMAMPGDQPRCARMVTRVNQMPCPRSARRRKHVYSALGDGEEADVERVQARVDAEFPGKAPGLTQIT